MAGAPSDNSRALRPRPDDFDVVFVEHGRLECETWYRAGRNTVTRWLKESGKAKLLKRRRQFVKAQRSSHERSSTRSDPAPASPANIEPEVIELAARYLQMKQNGSWVVYLCECGLWMLGTRRRTAIELLDKAKEKGFDVRRARIQIKTFAEGRD